MAGDHKAIQIELTVSRPVQAQCRQEATQPFQAHQQETVSSLEYWPGNSHDSEAEEELEPAQAVYHARSPHIRQQLAQEHTQFVQTDLQAQASRVHDQVQKQHSQNCRFAGVKQG